MTTDDDTPSNGQDSIGIDSDEYPPLQDATDREIAEILEERKQIARKAVDRVGEALLNEDVPLTDEKVHNLWKVGHELDALADSLVRRVPAEHRLDPNGDFYDGYYEMDDE